MLEPYSIRCVKDRKRHACVFRVCVWFPHVCINALGCLLKTVNRIMLLSFALDFTALGNVGAAFLGILYENVLMGALMDTLQP